MSLITNLKAWIFGNKDTQVSTPVTLSDQPCRFRLDNDSSATLTLPDGRKLGYAQYGSLTGRAVLYQHGFPGSRLEAAQHHDICMELGLRMIAIDRPGYGWSSPHPGGKLLDWPKDLEVLTEHLGLENYSVMVRVHSLIASVDWKLNITILDREYQAVDPQHWLVHMLYHLRNSNAFLSSAAWGRQISACVEQIYHTS
jgi:pimeloyl-ACP methyl ester carboxylesterase